MHSHIEVKVCPICGERQIVSVLVEEDTDSGMERIIHQTEKVSGYKLCLDDMVNIAAGLIALVEIDYSQPPEEDFVDFEEGKRTGRVFLLTERTIKEFYSGDISKRIYFVSVDFGNKLSKNVHAVCLN